MWCVCFKKKTNKDGQFSHTNTHAGAWEFHKGSHSYSYSYSHSHTVQNAHVALCACGSICVWRHFHKQPKKQFAFFRWLLWLFNNFCVYIVDCCCLVRRLNKFFRFLFAYFSQSSSSFSPNPSAQDYLYLYFCTCIRIWICTCSCLCQSFHIYSFSLRFHCGFGFGSSHSFLIKCINQNDRLPSNVGYKKQKEKHNFRNNNKARAEESKVPQFYFHVPFNFPSWRQITEGEIRLSSPIMTFVFNCIEFACGENAAASLSNTHKNRGHLRKTKKKNKLKYGRK